MTARTTEEELVYLKGQVEALQELLFLVMTLLDDVPDTTGLIQEIRNHMEEAEKGTTRTVRSGGLPLWEEGFRDLYQGITARLSQRT